MGLREVQLLQGIHCRLPVLRRGLERGRVLQEEPTYCRLREVQLLQGIHCRLPVLRRGLERERVLQEEPIYWRLREVQELLPGIQCQVRGVQGCEKYHKGDGGKGCCKAFTAECLACSEGKSVKKFCKKKKNRDVPGCEKKGCCKAFTADCLACSKGKSVKRFCKKKRNRDVPGCE